ncbi:uncharacterized protein LOC133199439 [Saccostrea echinata]|uniref:uncharacterized protein LOC133199439 n=1 Tax=Saccostrea echinata TaxID=191078 RepID=UPI002A8028E6|nr:uncharacterized protein LOC133199439 [Saccostrea echinata]
MDSSVLLVYENDGFQIVDIVSKRLAEYDTKVYTSKLQQIIDSPAYSATVLILTPQMLAVLNSLVSTDLLHVQHNKSKCALFVHEYININNESVQEILRNKLPSFPDWTVYHFAKKVRPLILQILEFLGIEQEDADPELQLVSNIKFYPDTEWEENQDVFISFNSKIESEDIVIVAINSNMIKTTWVNPYTSAFRVTDICGCGKRTVTIYVNEVPLGTAHVVIKDRDQILADEINDVCSPLHYLKEILKRTQGKEEKLHSDITDSLILEGTRKLLKRLQKKFYESDKEEKPNKVLNDQTPEEHAITSAETEDIVRLRPNRHSIRNKRLQASNIQDDSGLCIEQLARQTQRISLVQQDLSLEEEFPSIKHDDELLRSLPPDFFESLQE